MLRKLRKPSHARNNSAKKWFAYFVFGLICLVFVFFTPIGSQLSGGYGEGVVAYVGKEALRSREYNLIESALRREYSDQLNRGSEKEANQIRDRLRQRALRELVQIHLMAQGAKKNDFLVSDQEVIDEIRGITAFQEKGQFVYSLYDAFLKNRRWNARAFEKRIRYQILARNWNIMFFQSIRSNKAERALIKKQNRFQVNLRFVQMELGGDSTERIEVLTRDKNTNQLARLFKEMDKKWETTGFFSFLDSSIPKLGEKKKVLDKITEQFPSVGLVPEVIKTEGNQYVVEILSFRQKEEDSKQANAFMDFNFILDFNKPKALFENWVNYQREILKVRINNKFFNFDNTEL